MSHRAEQFASSLQRVIGQIISAGIQDPRVRGLISVTGVEIAPDKRHAKVHVSILPEDAERTSIAGLRAAAGYIRTEARKKIRTRSIPQLHFDLDHSLKKQAEVLHAIRQAVEGAEPAQTPEEETPS